ncbi:MAG TPA: helix-turn-helix domain-containing protein [Bryobacteraceae bacterium]|jgi:DNA-binding NtrC family response regulator
MKTIDDLVNTLLESSFFMEEAVELLEKGMITGALARTEGNQSEASKILGIHRNTLQRKMADYKIDGRRKKTVRRPMGRAAATKSKKKSASA